MSNTEIIPGMTEVMDYIKKQEEEIKDLNNRLMTCKMSIAIRDTEIKELKEASLESLDYCDVCDYLEYDPNDVIEKLKHDNHTIKEFVIEALGGKEFVGGEYPDDIKLRDIIECVEDLSCVKEENKKLQEENEKLKAFSNTQMRRDTKQTKRRNWDAAERKKLREEIEKLHKTINTMACSQATTDFCMKSWIIYDQIDPKLLLSNWEEFYEKDENGKWRKIEEEEEEEEEEDTNKMKEFLEQHNITENDFEQLVKESADYDLPK